MEGRNGSLGLRDDDNDDDDEGCTCVKIQKWRVKVILRHLQAVRNWNC